MNTKNNRILFIDFISQYKNSDVLSVGNYSRENAVNIKDQKVKESLVLDYQNALLVLSGKIPTNEQLTIKAAESQFYSSVIEPLFKWILAIESAIQKYEPNTLDFGDFYRTDAIYTYEAEGEVNKKWLYCSNYYLPSLILPLIKSKYPRISTVSKELSGFKVYKDFYLRNLIYLTASHFIAINRWVRSFFQKSQKVNFKNKIGLLVRNKIQSQFALKLYDHFYDEFYILNYEQVGSIKKNRNYLNSLNKEFIDLNKSVTFWKLTKSFFMGGRALFRQRKGLVLELYNGLLTIPMEFALKDLYIRSLDFRLYSNSLEIYKQNKFISFDMLTPQAHYIASVISKKNIVQMQTTLMNGKAQANFIAGNVFIHTDPISYEGMRESNTHLKSQLLLIDTPKALSKRARVSKGKLLNRVIYFTQPVELETEKKMLLKVQSMLLSRKIELYIKVHPRQKNINYSFLKEVKFIDSEFDSCLFDLAITRTSSIGLDCWIANLPIVFIRETRFMQSINANYLPKGFLGDLTCAEQLLSIINDYNEFVANFNKTRKTLNLVADDRSMFTTIKKGLNYEA